MEIEILYRPSYSLGVLKLDGGEEVRVEGGSMVSMSDGVVLETEATGGLLQSLGRSLLGGESFFGRTLDTAARIVAVSEDARRWLLSERPDVGELSFDGEDLLASRPRGATRASRRRPLRRPSIRSAGDRRRWPDR